LRPIPQIAVQFVADHEGFVGKAYPDPGSGGDPWTIGYGHTGPEVKPGQTMTKARALLVLRDDMQTAVRKLYSVVKPDVIDELTEEQYAALLSFTFNLGAKASWTIWKRVNGREWDRIPAELMKFTRAAGKVMKGLVNRRTDEVRLWNSGEPDHAPIPSSVTRQVGMTPPVPMDKPVSTSKTFWSGAAIAATSAAGGAQQVQAIVAPQAHNSELVQNLLAASAFAIVALGIAIMVFRYLDARKARS
jgi:lysozyme